MDVLDKFFKKFSYKFPKGYPDINDAQDVLLLETLLDQLIIFEVEDSENIPDDIEQIRATINTHPDYKNKVEAVIMNTTKRPFIYVKDVAASNRNVRLEITKDLIEKRVIT